MSALAKLIGFIKREFLELLPTMIYFLVGFNLITLSKQLILLEEGIAFVGWKQATIGALLVAKVVLVADKLPLMRLVTATPPITPTVYRAALYTLLVFIAQVVELTLEGWVATGGFGSGINHMVERFTPEYALFVYMWVFTLFLVYEAFEELRRAFHAPPVWKFFFVRSGQPNSRGRQDGKP